MKKFENYFDMYNYKYMTILIASNLKTKQTIFHCDENNMYKNKLDIIPYLYQTNYRKSQRLRTTKYSDLILNHR